MLVCVSCTIFFWLHSMEDTLLFFLFIPIMFLWEFYFSLLTFWLAAFPFTIFSPAMENLPSRMHSVMSSFLLVGIYSLMLLLFIRINMVGLSLDSNQIVGHLRFLNAHIIWFNLKITYRYLFLVHDNIYFSYVIF